MRAFRIVLHTSESSGNGHEFPSITTAGFASAVLGATGASAVRRLAFVPVFFPQ